MNNNEQLTLTEIFHQFDTITLRGRTSIDRYLNIQRDQQFTQQAKIENEQQLTVEISDRTRIPNISEENDQRKQILATQKYEKSSTECKQSFLLFEYLLILFSRSNSFPYSSIFTTTIYISKSRSNTCNITIWIKYFRIRNNIKQFTNYHSNNSNLHRSTSQI